MSDTIVPWRASAPSGWLACTQAFPFSEALCPRGTLLGTLFCDTGSQEPGRGLLTKPLHLRPGAKRQTESVTKGGDQVSPCWRGSCRKARAEGHGIHVTVGRVRDIRTDSPAAECGFRRFHTEILMIRCVDMVRRGHGWIRDTVQLEWPWREAASFASVWTESEPWDWAKCFYLGNCCNRLMSVNFPKMESVVSV